MKTIVIWESFDAAAQFFVLNGDYSHLDGVYINAADGDLDLQDELSEIVYRSNEEQQADPEAGYYRVKMRRKFPIVTAVKNYNKGEGLKIVQCGMLP
jgi:hypothetical protein